MVRALKLDRASVSVRVPAKVNLFLAVRGVRGDGYHEIVSVMQTVSVYDRITARLSGPPGHGHHPSMRRRMRLEVDLPRDEGLPDPEENLAVQAARVIGEAAGFAELGAVAASRWPIRPPGPRTLLELEKRIPVASGMAGGSADAAATLLALNKLWRCELSRDELRELAARLGSDVPFCVVGGTALATGTGTSVAQVLCRGPFHWVVATDSEPLSTRDVYRAWDRHCRPSVIEPDAVLHALRSDDPEALGAALHNDLQDAAFALRPDLAERREALLRAGALGVVVTGSGPTLLALAAGPDEAGSIAEALRANGLDAVVAESPVGGPELTST